MVSSEILEFCARRRGLGQAPVFIATVCNSYYTT